MYSERITNKTNDNNVNYSLLKITSSIDINPITRVPLAWNHNVDWRKDIVLKINLEGIIISVLGLDSTDIRFKRQKNQVKAKLNKKINKTKIDLERGGKKEIIDPRKSLSL